MRYFILAWLLVAVGWAHAQNTITHYEYWFDQDHEARTSVEVASTTPAIDLPNESPDVSMLSVGPHRIHYRLKDSHGRWSGVLRRDFMRLPGGPHHIVGFEYWFDRDDAANQRTYMEVGSPATDVDLIADIDMFSIPVGAHRIHYRLKDSHGRWSGVLHRSFRRNHNGPYELVLLRYWSHPHPTNPSDKIEVPITPAVQYLDILDDVLFCNWSVTGDSTKVYFQLKDNHGQWSSVVTRTVDIDMVATVPAQPGPINGMTTVLEGGTATYSVTPVPGASQYTWTPPIGWSGTSTTNSITLTAGAGGTSGVLTVTAQNTCGTSPAREHEVYVTGVGLREEGATASTLLFPNPTSGQFTVTAGRPITHLLVYNSTGQVVRELGNTGTDRVDLALDNAAAGLYAVRVFHGDEHVDLRLMLQH